MIKIKIVFLVFILGFMTRDIYADNKVDSLRSLLDSDVEDTTRFRVMEKLSRILQNEDLDQSLQYAEEALKFAEENNIRPEIEYLDFVIYLNDISGRYEQSVEYLAKKIQLLYPPKSKLDKVMILKTEGYLKFREGKYSKALDFFKEAFEMAEKEGFQEERNLLYFDFARVYQMAGDLEKEREYYYMYLEHVDQADETKVNYISRVYLRLAGIEMDLENFAEANRLFSKSLEMAESRKDSSQMCVILNHMAWNTYLSGNLDSSLMLYKQNIRIALAIDSRSFLGNCYGNIGNIYRDWEDYDQAIFYYKKSLEFAEQESDFYALSWLNEDLSRMYARQGDYKRAYEKYMLHSQYYDSLQQDRYNQRLYEARSRFEADQKAREFELLEVKLQQNRYLTYGISAGFALLLIIGGLVFYQNKIISRQRISEMNHSLSELNQRNLRQQMNPHFIFNTLNSIQYYVFRNDKISANEYMTKFAKLIRMTLENSRSASISIRDELEALKLYLELETIRFKGKFKWEITVDEEIDTLLYRVPTMLIQPFVENSLVHGLMNKDNGEGFVGIDLRLYDEFILCTIEDNGIGREKAMKIKEEKNGNHNSLGTRITESRLKLVNSLYGKNMRIKYTDLRDENGEATGTRVEISIPVVG